MLTFIKNMSRTKTFPRAKKIAAHVSYYGRALLGFAESIKFLRQQVTQEALRKRFFKLRARQGELLATQPMMDHLALEEVQPVDKPRVGKLRGRRTCWVAPEWLKLLAKQAEPRRKQLGRCARSS
eukprot:6463928-Amphidinium_carterae.1